MGAMQAKLEAYFSRRKRE